MTMTGTRFVFVIIAASAPVSVVCSECPRFSRPTVKCKVLQNTPKWHRKVHDDEAYEMVSRNYGNNEYEPGFFAHDKVRGRWIQITRISTEHARFGRSPDFNDIPLQVSWDFRYLADKKYVALPLRTSGSIVFPDRV